MTSAESSCILIGYSREGTFAHLVAMARKRLPSAVVVDLNLLETCDRCSLERSGGGLRLTIDELQVAIKAQASIFYRGFVRPSTSEVRSDLVRRFLNDLEAALQLLPDRCRVFNRPLAGASNASKTLHVKLLRDCGFRTPQTLLSNAPSLVEQRVPPNHSWVSKGCSGTRTIAASIGPLESTRLGNLARIPSLFQERIVGYDVRVHFVGSDYVALRIDSNRLDYRYAKRQGGQISTSVIDLPPSERFKAIEFMHRHGLLFAGFDFKVDEQGNWWVLEANPMPGFEFFDKYADGAISNLLLRQLAGDDHTLLGKPVFDWRGGFIEGERVPEVDRGI